MGKEMGKISKELEKKDIYKILKKKRTRLVRTYTHTYYGRLAWNVGVLGTIPPRKNIFLDEIESRKNWGPAEKEILWGLYLSSTRWVANYPPTLVVDCLEKFYLKKFPKLFHNIYHDTFKGHPPKLSYTLAIQEFLSRGFIHKLDTQGFIKTEYGIVVHCAPLTWPTQFTSQQEAALFLIKNGINGHCGCPALEQQKNFTNGLR